MIHLVTLQAHDGVSVRTIYLATAPYTSFPGDTPANQFFSDRLEDAGLFARHMFAGGDGVSGGTTGGRSEVGYGDLTIVNNKPYGYDELLDDWVTWAFDGYPITIQKIADDRTPLTDAETIFTGTIEQIVSTDALNQFTLKIHDALADLDQPLLTNRYLGTTTSGGVTPGAEGNADIKDQIKPKVWGRCINVPCVSVNPYELIYQVSDGEVNSIAPYDGGVALTATSNYSTLAALRAATLVAGQYATCNLLGLFRIGRKPDFQLTADVVEGATTASRTMAQIMLRMMAHFGLTSSDWTAATFTALDVLNSSECGIRVEGDETALSAISRVANYGGVWFAPNALGKFEVGRLDAPEEADAVATFDLEDNLDNPPQRIETGDDGKGIPAYSVTVLYDRVHVPMRSSEIAGNVTVERAGYLAQEYRSVTVEDTSILTKYPNAPKLTIETNLATSAAATTEATRQLNLRKVLREMYAFELPAESAEDVQLGSTVMLESEGERMGLADGKPFIAVTRQDSRKDVPTISFEFWG